MLQLHFVVFQYLKRFSLVPMFSEEDFQHWFLPREDIIDAYVVEKATETGNRITDLVSFYTLPSTVMSHPTHNNLKAAYSFYNVATSASWVDLIGDALVLAKKVWNGNPYTSKIRKLICRGESPYINSSFLVTGHCAPDSST